LNIKLKDIEYENLHDLMRTSAKRNVRSYDFMIHAEEREKIE